MGSDVGCAARQGPSDTCETAPVSVPKQPRPATSVAAPGESANADLCCHSHREVILGNRTMCIKFHGRPIGATAYVFSYVVLCSFGSWPSAMDAPCRRL